MKAELTKPFEARITEMIARQGEVTLAIEGPIVQIWCGMFADLLASYPGAENYLSIDFQDKKGQWWNLMLQRKSGKTPVDIVVEKIAEINHLRQQLAALEAAQSEQNG